MTGRPVDEAALADDERAALDLAVARLLGLTPPATTLPLDDVAEGEKPPACRAGPRGLPARNLG